MMSAKAPVDLAVDAGTQCSGWLHVLYTGRMTQIMHADARHRPDIRKL
jgi:hypothetical protein